jgi:two-component system, OmpR family, sensor histidine kinase KdpD
VDRTREARLVTGLLAVTASVAAVTLLNYGIREVAPPVSTGVVYLLAVLFVSSRWGLAFGLCAAFLSAGAFNFFHIPPTGRFTIAEAENWVALSVFLVVAVVTSALADAAHARADEAEQRRREADLSAEMARILLSGADPEEPLKEVGHRIAQAYGLASVSVEPGWIDSDERRKAVPLVVGGSRTGTVLVPQATDESTMTSLRERIVPALETLIAAARRRQELESQVIETKALRRSNVVQRALLRSVSHDLRSPLTAITAAAEGLESPTLSDESRRELTSVVADESARLSRLVDNLLDLSRLQAGSAEPRRDWCSVEEVIHAAADGVTPPAAGFELALDPDLPLVNCDAAQLERAFANVMDNAARYAGDEPVSVRAHTAVPWLIVRVSDHGPGIPKEELERIFEPFHRVDEHRDGGSGLGLAIARGFVEANDGRLRAQSLPGQGTSFVFQLPVPA